MLFTKGFAQVTPHDVNYDENRLTVLHRHFQTLIDDNEIQCATYCLSRKGQVFASGAVGKKHFQKDEPALADSVRFIASVTKSFTAVAIMKLVEDGLTRLDVPVAEILPQFDTPPYNQINLFHLLSHSSGMHADGGCFENKYQIDYWKLIERAYKCHDPQKDGEFDWIAASLGVVGNGMRTKPGEEWAYCSFGYVILGAVIEKLTGINANKYIEDYICKPLGLKDTTFDLTPEMAKRYIITDEEVEKDIQNVIEGKKDEDEWIGKKLNMPSTAGGLFGSAVDLNIFGNMMLHNGTFNGVRILGRKANEKMTTLQEALPNYTWWANEPARYYGAGLDMRNGIGFTYSKETFMHEGAGACSMIIDPKEELVAAWLVPFAREGWFNRAQFNVSNVIWSGLK